MSLDHSYPQLAIDRSSFAHALENGALDTCLDYLRHNDISGAEAARLACRLGEKLFHAGRTSEALACGRMAFNAAANDNDVVHFCGIMAQIPITPPMA